MLLHRRPLQLLSPLTREGLPAGLVDNYQARLHLVCVSIVNVTTTTRTTTRYGEVWSGARREVS
ncbi:hypothetical protein MFU01_39790 [Myxococcus fulvus]|uniref:Uncharacterized protein n=1 Tax=Myxococcus fulvus TaxID=33 RepID=A0A511T5Y5_MYXFU|nr:hypothetical protein MFU01_39790 [Myxococcus fulvus]